jgi:hypothetical protein
MWGYDSAAPERAEVSHAGEHIRLGARYLSELTEAKQVEIERELGRVFTADLPLLPLMYEPEIIVKGGGLTGVSAITGTSHNGQIMHTWNMHEWDIQSRG